MFTFAKLLTFEKGTPQLRWATEELLFQRESGKISIRNKMRVMASSEHGPKGPIEGPELSLVRIGA
jgi:hypothetical protein